MFMTLMVCDIGMKKMKMKKKKKKGKRTKTSNLIVDHFSLAFFNLLVA